MTISNVPPRYANESPQSPGKHLGLSFLLAQRHRKSTVNTRMRKMRSKCRKEITKSNNNKKKPGGEELTGADQSLLCLLSNTVILQAKQVFPSIAEYLHFPTGSEKGCCHLAEPSTAAATMKSFFILP